MLLMVSDLRCRFKNKSKTRLTLWLLALLSPPRHGNLGDRGEPAGNGGRGENRKRSEKNSNLMLTPAVSPLRCSPRTGNRAESAKQTVAKKFEKTG
jgi:hypothetical protein